MIMKRMYMILAMTAILLLSALPAQSAEVSNDLTEKIRQDRKLDQVYEMARELIKSGFNAGTSYGEVWIRDFNTFIEVSCDVLLHEQVKENLLIFFKFQGDDGNIIDGFIPKEKAHVSYDFIYTDRAPQYAAHKNTVETDQESSLVQAVSKYIQKTGDVSILQENVFGKTVLERLEMAMQFLLNKRFSEKYGLLWGATTADWSDIQPEHKWGVVIDKNTHPAIDVYDNAMFVIALNDLLPMIHDSGRKARWTKIRDQVRKNIRKYLWDAKAQKFIPHIYLQGSPFPKDFDESNIFYHGGTAVAIEAGLLSKDEIAAVNAQMLKDQKMAKAQSIGITLYPPYPAGLYKNKSMLPYVYQNAGDWTWFGGRMIQQLVRYGFVEQAYREIQPMLDRVLKERDFREWYTPEGKPMGAARFRGSAGVLAKAIELLREAVGGRTREIKITKKYLNFPVNNSDKHVRMKIIADDKNWRLFDIQLAESDPQYWVFADVSELAGKSVLLKMDGDAVASKGFQQIYQDDRIAGEDSLYREQLRPQFHFSTRRGWTNDPNGLVYYDGEYHLFYQHNPYSTKWGNMHWGHAVSTDLIHWQELADALVMDEQYSIWSGSAVIDSNNTAGFQTGNEKPLVAAFSGDVEDKHQLQVQCIAYSNDRGRTWTKYNRNPVIGDRRKIWGTRNIRDPKVFWYKAGGYWVMALYEQLGNSIFTSDNLKDWTFRSHTEGFYECPEMFELPVDGDPNNTKWIMYSASGSYVIGEFDGEKFSWESGKHWYKDGPLYAAQTFNNIPESDGRRIQMAWGRIASPGMPFNQMMLFPTELTLRTTTRGVRLFCEPIKEIEQLHTKEYQWQNMSLNDINEKLEAVQGKLLHIKCEIENIDAQKFGLIIDGNRLIYDVGNGDRFNGFPYSLQPDSNSLTMEILVDKTSIETFLDHGALYSIMAKDLKAKKKGVRIWTNGSNKRLLVRNMQVFELKSIWY